MLCSVLPVLLLETNHQIEDLPPPGPGGELRRLRREIYYSYFRYIRNATRRQPIIGKCSSLTSVILVFARTSSTPSLPRTPWGLRFVFIAGGFDAHRRRVRAGVPGGAGCASACELVCFTVQSP
jgi:hypothetical protein